MKADVRKHKKTMRAILLLEKIKAGKEWGIEALIAYCQGKAYAVAEDAALAVASCKCRDLESRKETLKVALMAMLEEIMEHLKVLEDN